MNRRDFVIGSVTGIAVGAGGSLAATKMMLKPEVVAPAASPPQPADMAKARISYAQNGEDLILNQALEVLRVQKPDYIDIGAWDPVIGSNTYFFYKLGSRGVLVEPNPVYCDKLRAVRTGDVVVNAGVGAIEETQADYYVIHGEGQLNTFDLEEVQELKKHDPNIVKEVIKMPLLNLNKVLEKNFKSPPALLSVDTEGMDLQILKTLDFDKWRSKVVIAEAALKNALINEEIVKFMESKGYIYRGGNLVNAVFIDRKLLG